MQLLDIVHLDLPPSGPARVLTEGPVPEGWTSLLGEIAVQGLDLGPWPLRVPPKSGKPPLIDVTARFDPERLALIAEGTPELDWGRCPEARQVLESAAQRIQSAIAETTSMPDPGQVGGAHLSARLPHLDWPAALADGRKAIPSSEHLRRNNALRAFDRQFTDLRSSLTERGNPFGPDINDRRLGRFLDWIVAIPRPVPTTFIVRATPDLTQIEVFLRHQAPGSLVLRTKELRAADDRLRIDTVSGRDALVAPDRFARRKLIALGRCLESVWYGPNPRLTACIELVSKRTRRWELSIDDSDWGLKWMLFALGRASEQESNSGPALREVRRPESEVQ